ncbi:hypothetical protein LptCag_0340 [Leptospirillum ferriphilum]|uniref:Uncharacterized protein n=1 Tax=Leptospirillum ferriphilum TaxID=178606 RepID=A0A094X404_9BACT|nr:hypothetical protein LptCag_0340 [Leptospirillum ferriphilum]
MCRRNLPAPDKPRVLLKDRLRLSRVSPEEMAGEHPRRFCAGRMSKGALF